MGKEDHDIELFRRLIAPRHTAFNVKASAQFFCCRKSKKSNIKKKKPPPARWSYLELLNVLIWEKILFPRCRAPPFQGFSQKFLKIRRKKPCG